VRPTVAGGGAIGRAAGAWGGLFIRAGGAAYDGVALEAGERPLVSGDRSGRALAFESRGSWRQRLGDCSGGGTAGPFGTLGEPVRVLGRFSPSDFEGVVRSTGVPGR
jgi:hypothetical protein